jgi:hypothetical protein
MIQTHSNTPKLILRTREALVRGLIWAFIGTLYGMLFVFFAVLAADWQLPVHPYFFSGVLAGTIGALIYSSMRLAVLMATIITPISSLLLLLSNAPMKPLNLIFIVGMIGGVIGAFYGHFSTASRVHRADAKTLTGFSAGFLVSLGYLVFSGQMTDLSLGIVIGVMCPMTGWLYVFLVPTFIRLFNNLLPPMGDGALVGIGVAIFLALCIFVMTNSITTDSAGAYLPLIDHIQRLLPQAIMGGFVGGGVAGVLSGLFVSRWQDL